MRVATVDIGTNTVLLLIAETTSGGLVAIEERATLTRLGQGVDETRVLHPEAVERTCACLTQYVERIQAHRVDRIAVVGTSAMRDAVGGSKIFELVASRLGTSVRVISGHEEARLMFAGSVSGLGELDSPLVAFDVGGGSTEVVRGVRARDGQTDLDYFESFDVGSVRLTERHPFSDPPSETELETTRTNVAAVFASIPVRAQGRPTIGTAGTVTTLAAISLGMTTYEPSRVHGYTMSVAKLEQVVARLAAATLAERKSLPGLHQGRADIIVAGGLVVLAILRQLEATDMRVSNRGLRWGLAEELAERAKPGGSAGTHELS
jgi:exopolyphosphatase/guanosine-5'-triphosphate,3'-diphosphate pyrophosphatase